jgi:flagellar hook-basal body complex protein FliE
MIIPPVGGLGIESSALSAGSLGEGVQSGAAATGGEPLSFGGALSEAVSSLEQTQQSAAGASQELAMGTASNPESAVVTVEDAQLAMQLASQIRTKATEAAQSIFQTQV